MAEGGVDRITAMRVTGHVTDKMWSQYSQVRMDSVREKLTEAFRSSSRALGGSRVVAFQVSPARA